MSSIDDRGDWPDYPLSRPGIAIFVGGGILMVGLILVLVVNMVFPLRPPTLALRFLLPTWLVETGSRLEEAPGNFWHRQHTLAFVLIILFVVIGPIVLVQSIRRILQSEGNHRTLREAWLAGLGLAVGSGLTFSALVGPLIALPATVIADHREKKSIDRLVERTLLAADMEMMALRAQALYFGAADTLTAWEGGPTTAPVSLADLSVGDPPLASMLTGDARLQQSLFVLSVTHADTILIYGTRGTAATHFDQQTVLEACSRGEAPPGIIITPNSRQWTFG